MDAQGFAAAGEDVQARAGPQQVITNLSANIYQMLAVI
jgi:hypothetical protein